MNDTDEDIDTADIDEEDWIECKKRSTEENSENPKMDQNTQKNEIENGVENCIFTRRKMDRKSC